MRIKINGKAQSLKIHKNCKIREILEKAGIQPETVVTKVNGKITPLDELIKKSCNIEVIKVVSSG